MTTATTATATAATTNTPARTRRRRRVLFVSATLILLLAAWAAYDLYAPRRTNLRDFDAERAERFELEWWIVHRERARHAPGDLDHALASLAAEIYRVPAEKLSEHARLRAEAMEIRDRRAEQGGVTEED